MITKKLDVDESYTDDQYVATARANCCDDELEIDETPKVSRSESDGGAWVAAWVWVSDAAVEEAQALPTHLNGFQVRHDMLGWYVCSDEEAAFEDEGNASEGFDGRDHWSTLDLACEALQEIAND